MKRAEYLLIILIIAGLLLTAGCKDEPSKIKVTKKVTRSAEPATSDYSPSGSDTVLPPEEKTIDYEAEEENSEQDWQDEEPEAGVTIEMAPYCGDGECGDDENCGSCYDDCRCVSPAECHGGECTVPECGSNAECPKGDECTVATCYFAGHPNAYCGFKDLTVCRDGDDCCPRNCDAVEDDDCDSECGNGECEHDEDGSDCPEDCGPDYCGDGQCNGQEDGASCPEDCGYVCGNDKCEPGEDYNNCDSDCCEPDQWYADDEDCECGDEYSRQSANNGFVCEE
ncbi:hypothetical protein KY362_02930 [Candidatus Woesearchaeota archaeon]|nr:hypothetical protein [Candidatus Woesearchaeota archaeon]